MEHDEETTLVALAHPAADVTVRLIPNDVIAVFQGGLRKYWKSVRALGRDEDDPETILAQRKMEREMMVAHVRRVRMIDQDRIIEDRDALLEFLSSIPFVAYQRVYAAMSGSDELKEHERKV